MGDIGLDLVGRQPNIGDAVDELIKAAYEYDEVLELVMLGPLTNLALALKKDPSIALKIKRCVVMGAVADHIGNVTPVAEFNMWFDPEAVDVVLRSGIKLEFVGWDVSRKFAVITPADSALLRAMNTPFATFTMDIQRLLEKYTANETHLAGFDLPDPITIAYAINSSVANEIREMYLVVETKSQATEGMVVMDTLDVLH